MIRAIIIDDNPLAIATLKADVAEYCDQVELVGTAGGIVEAAKLLKEVKTDLLFLDIHMNNGTGFDLLDIIEKDKYQVIFTTASSDFALKAFQYAAVDYLLKPIDPDRLQEAVKKLSTPLGSSHIELLKQDKPTRIALSTSDEIRITNVNEIIRLESSNNYTTFYLDSGDKILVSKTLKEFTFLEQQGFLRVHQSHLINLDKVKSYVKTEGGYIMMQDDSHIPVATRRKAEVVKLLQL